MHQHCFQLGSVYFFYVNTHIGGQLRDLTQLECLQAFKSKAIMIFWFWLGGGHALHLGVARQADIEGGVFHGGGTSKAQTLSQYRNEIDLQMLLRMPVCL